MFQKMKYYWWKWFGSAGSEPTKTIEAPVTEKTPAPVIVPTLEMPNFPEGPERCRVLKYLHPCMRDKIESALDECHQKGLMVHVFESYRTPLRQKQLWGKGRNDPGRKVTNAQAMQSWHNYGLAFDLVFDGDERDGIQWSWEGDYNNEVVGGDKRSDYMRVGEIFESYGFEWAVRWKTFKEMPHFQMVNGLTVQEAEKIFNEGGLAAVWEKV